MVREGMRVIVVAVTAVHERTNLWIGYIRYLYWGLFRSYIILDSESLTVYLS